MDMNLKANLRYFCSPKMTPRNTHLTTGFSQLSGLTGVHGETPPKPWGKLEKQQQLESTTISRVSKSQGWG